MFRAERCQDVDDQDPFNAEGPIERATAPVLPDPEVPARHARRRFTTAYKLEILRKADACNHLRREWCELRWQFAPFMRLMPARTATDFDEL